MDKEIWDVGRVVIWSQFNYIERGALRVRERQLGGIKTREQARERKRREALEHTNDSAIGTVQRHEASYGQATAKEKGMQVFVA